jgi:hypothetical protein
MLSPSTPAYGWDRKSKSAFEAVDGDRYFANIQEGELTRGALLEAAGNSTRVNRFKVHKNSASGTRVRKRKIA